MYIYSLTFFCLQLFMLTFCKDARIIGGADTSVVKFPFLASLRRIADNVHVCAGTIISNEHILTAARCFKSLNLNETNMQIILGSTFLSKKTGSTFFAEKIMIHPEYQQLINVRSYTNDIAVVKVNRIILFSKYQRKIFLPSQDIYTGSVASISGWGSKIYPSHELADRIQNTWMIIYEGQRCAAFHSLIIHNDQFCGYQKPGVGPCVGDTGGPVINNDSVIGIIAANGPCANGKPDIYTKVYSHLDFIINGMHM